MSNYTDEMVARISDAYSAAPTRETVDALAAELDRPVRSIISKLSALGIYQKQEQVTKSGKPIVRKEEYVAQIQAALGNEFPSMEKMTKTDLARLVQVLAS
jgi:hypothetical protein